MLSSMRQSAGSWVVKGLLFLLILSFGVWGVADFLTSRSTGGAVITVGATEIGPREVMREFDRELAGLRPMLGGDLSREQARQLGVLDRTVQQMLGRAVLLEAAREHGVRVTDAALRDSLRDTPEFQTDSGAFDRDLFARVVRQAGFTEEGYLETLRHEMTQARMMGPAAEAALAPELLAKTIFAYREERRVAEVAVVETADQSLPGIPPAEAIEQYYQDNIARWEAPEYRGFAAVLLTRATVAPTIEIPEEDLRAEYEAQRSAFTSGERRTVEQVVFDDQEAAQAVFDAVQSGAPLVDAALDAGLEVTPLGTIARDEIMTDLADPIFDLPEGTVGPPTESPLGWHLFRVTEVLPPETQGFEEVKDRLAADLIEMRLLDVIYDKSIQVEDALAGGASVEQAAAEVGVPAVTVTAVDANGMTPTGAPVETLPEQQGEFLRTVFSMDPASTSPLLEVGDGYYVVRLNEVVPAAPRPLDAVRDQVVTAWRTEQRQAMARERAEALRADLDNGDAVAAASLTQPFTRDGQGADLPGALVARLFEGLPGDTALTETANGFMVARLARVVPADPAANADSLTRLREQLARSIAQDASVAFTASLADQLGAEVDMAPLNAQFGE